MTGGSVIGNEAKKHGGGIYADIDSYIEIKDSTISGNRAGNYGGGIHAFSSRLVSGDSRITGNSAKYGGGIFLQNSNYSNEINNTVICGNKAALWGGGAFIDEENGSFTMNGGEVCNNEIIYKDADSDPLGGGIHLF
jgi:predicted outer membrane repeat protein